MRMAKLLMPAGAPDQDSCGETLSPTQFGFCGFLLATFFGIIWPSWKVVDLSEKPCALASWLVHANAKTIPAPANIVPICPLTSMAISLWLVWLRLSVAVLT